MLPTQTTRPERQVRAEDSPEGALMMTGNGNLAIPVGTFSAQLIGDVSSRLLWDISARGLWTILSSTEHELELPEETFTLFGRPSTSKDLAGVDANGRGVEWLETSRIDHRNNARKWFTFKSGDPLADTAVAYPVLAWFI